MVGLVIITHGSLGRELLGASEQIVGRLDACEVVSVIPGEPPEEFKKRILSAVRNAGSGRGVLILTDMFGGSPSNLSIPLIEKDNVELVTGVNLPIMIRLARARAEKSLEELAREVVEYGRRSICQPSEILKEEG